MHVIVVGGGKVGLRLASLLRSSQHDITVIEVNAAKVDQLRKDLDPDAVIHGSGSDPAILEAAGVRTADVVAAVAGKDEVNLVVSSLARFEFRVPRTIARVNNPKNAWMFTSVMGVDVAVNPADLMAHLIVEQMSLGDVLAHSGPGSP
jgi:trk system potassium uptake protein TrkA